MGVTTDAQNNIYAIGYIGGTFDRLPYAGSDDIALVVYNSTGYKLYSHLYGGVNADQGQSIVIDPTGEVAYIIAALLNYNTGQSAFGM